MKVNWFRSYLVEFALIHYMQVDQLTTSYPGYFLVSITLRFWVIFGNSFEVDLIKGWI